MKFQYATLWGSVTMCNADFNCRWGDLQSTLTTFKSHSLGSMYEKALAISVFISYEGVYKNSYMSENMCTTIKDISLFTVTMATNGTIYTSNIKTGKIRYCFGYEKLWNRLEFDFIDFICGF